MPDISPRAERERRLVVAIRQQLGPVICGALDDPEVIEVMLNPSGEVWEDRLGSGMRVICTMDPIAAHSFIGIVASTLHTTVARESPLLQAELPIRGARFQAAIPPVSSVPIFSVRLKATRIFPLADYVASGAMSAKQRTTIEDSVSAHKNILLVGSTGAGKTTLGNAVLAEIAERTPQDRILILEDTVELQCTAPNVVALRSTDQVDMQRLLKITLRLRPDRIVVGEVRGGEALDMLKAFNTGHPGGLCTIHANSAAAGLTRLEQLVAEVTPAPMQAVIAEAIDLLVPIVKTKDGRRVVKPFIEVNGFRDGHYVLAQLEN